MVAVLSLLIYDSYGAPYGAPSSGYNAPHQGQYNSPPPQHGYASPPPSVPYGSHSTSQFGSPAPPQQYGAYPPPVTSTTVPPLPQLPSGWQPLWDPVGQRWAYLETGNGRVDWNVPVNPSYAHGDANRGFGDGHDGHGGHGGHGGYGGHEHDSYSHGHGGGYGEEHKSKDKAKDDKKNLMLGVAGGLAVGAVGGAVIANALGEFTFSCPVVTIRSLHVVKPREESVLIVS